MNAGEKDNNSRVGSNGRYPSAAGKIRVGVSGFLRDTLELIELQTLLLREDLRLAKRSLVVGIAAAAAAAVLGLSTVTVLLAAAGAGLSDAVDWPVWAGQLVVSGAALLVVAALAGGSIYLLLRATRPLGRTSRELSSNWSAVKAALSRHSDEEELAAYEERLAAYRFEQMHRR